MDFQLTCHNTWNFFKYIYFQKFPVVHMRTHLLTQFDDDQHYPCDICQFCTWYMGESTVKCTTKNTC